jgi:hypothetical protein
VAAISESTPSATPGSRNWSLAISSERASISSSLRRSNTCAARSEPIETSSTAAFWRPLTLASAADAAALDASAVDCGWKTSTAPT